MKAGRNLPHLLVTWKSGAWNMESSKAAQYRVLTGRRQAAELWNPSRLLGNRDDSLAEDVSRIDQISIFAAFTMPKGKQMNQPASF